MSFPVTFLPLHHLEASRCSLASILACSIGLWRLLFCCGNDAKIWNDHGFGAIWYLIFRRLISDITNLTGQFVLADVIPFPFLKWLDPKGYIKRMKKVSEELDGILEVWIEEHLRRRWSSREVGSDEQDFIDVLLSNIDDRLVKIHGKAKMIIIKSTLVDSN